MTSAIEKSVDDLRVWTEECIPARQTRRGRGHARDTARADQVGRQRPQDWVPTRLWQQVRTGRTDYDTISITDKFGSKKPDPKSPRKRRHARDMVLRRHSLDDKPSTESFEAKTESNRKKADQVFKYLKKNMETKKLNGNKK
ncbi:hypothetical protein E4U49_001971 [Claviceps purpurea]|nr:hypothetical protein E4U49_001971 [Claviceps purpurea]